jgi:RNA polymerase sigma-70 factor (ECF subfamily)
MNTIETLEDIRSANQTQLHTLYTSFRGEFGQWITRYYNTDEEMAGEIYQQAFIAFYYNIRDGKVSTLSSSLKTYLFAIGKNIAREQFRINARFIPEEDNINLDEWDTSMEDSLEVTERQMALDHVLKKMGDPCQTVLRLYYFDDYSMAAIAEAMKYKTEQIAAKRKFICLQQIRKLLKDTSYFTQS